MSFIRTYQHLVGTYIVYVPPNKHRPEELMFTEDYLANMQLVCQMMPGLKVGICHPKLADCFCPLWRYVDTHMSTNHDRSNKVRLKFD